MTQLPPLDVCGYLVNMAAECGMYQIGWQEINAWASATRTRLTPWEACAIHRIGRAYTNAVSEYQNKALPAPYSAGVTNKEAVAKKAKSAFRRKKR